MELMQVLKSGIGMEYLVIIFIPITTVLLTILLVKQDKKNSIPPVLLTACMLSGAFIGDTLIRPTQEGLDCFPSPYYWIGGLVLGLVLYIVFHFIYKKVIFKQAQVS